MVAGGFLKDKLTDSRRSREANRGAKQDFQRLVADIPEVIADMANMLRKKPVAREFCVTGGNTLYFICPPTFTHQSGKHEDLVSKVQMLENCGYVMEVTKRDSNCPKYRMTEEFVTLVRNHH